jgi:universal stress protein A
VLTIQTILHPTDFSPSSDYAFRLAHSLAHDHGSKLIVVHVVATLGAELVSYGEAVTQLEPEAYRDKLWAELRQVRSPDSQVQVEHELAEGDAANEIVRLAREKGCGLIVMGTHGRRGISRLLMGSVAEQVVRRAPCPVLTVKMPEGSPAASS